MTKYNTINRYLFVFMAIMLLAASMVFGTNANLKLHAEEEITDLTGTTWQFKDTCTYSGDGSSRVQFNVNFVDQDNHVFGRMTAPYYQYGTVMYTVGFGEPGDTWLRYFIDEDDYYYQGVSDGEGWYIARAESGEFNKSTPPRITITGGDDATNESANFAALLTWLQANATLVPAEEPSTGVVENISLSVVMIISLVAVLTITTILNKKSKVIR